LQWVINYPGIVRDFEFAGNKVEHGNLIFPRMAAAGLAFERREPTVESFQKGGRQPEKIQGLWVPFF
jgi:hypothetical protein